jgi:hypothetical protein
MISGFFPSEVALLHRLEQLELSHTMLQGTIPEGFYTGLASLTGLYLDGCQFSGTISTMMGLLTNLVELNIADSAFHGNIPAELSAVSFLQNIQVNGNNFNGTFPEGVCTNLPATLERTITADCTPNADTGIPPMPCQCCTECCDRETGICVEQ